MENPKGDVPVSSTVERSGSPVEFGIWTLPATIGAVRIAANSKFEAAHYDAVERFVREHHGSEITRYDVESVRDARDNHEAAICQHCGLFHTPPACGAQ